MLFADRLICDSDQAMAWLAARHGTWDAGHCKSALGAGVFLHWEGELDDAIGFFHQPLVRRALLVRWYDEMLDLRYRGMRCFFCTIS